MRLIKFRAANYKINMGCGVGNHKWEKNQNEIHDDYCSECLKGGNK